MRYYVLDGQGNQYGPADVPTLNQWVRDGRILPGTQILVENTGKVIPAQMVPGLNLDMAPGLGLNPAGPQRQDPNMPQGFPGARQSGPYASYPRSGGAFGGVGDAMLGGAEFNRSLTMSGLSLVCCFFLPFLGVPLACAGIYFARRAQLMGHPGPQVATIAGILCLIITCFFSITSLAAIAFLQGMRGG